MRMLAVLLTVLVLAPITAAAQQVRLEFSNGSVTLQAENVPVRTILAEWSKRGGTRIINGDRVGGGPVTLELTGVPELQAIEILLRGVAGYLVGRREIAATGPGLNNPSIFDRIHVLPTSSAPRTTAPVSAAPAPRPPVLPRPPTPDDDDVIDDDLPFEPEPRLNQPGAQNQPGALGGGRLPAVRQVATPAQAPDDVEPPAPPSPVRGNPFGTVTGSSRPGVVVPPAQQAVPRTTPE